MRRLGLVRPCWFATSSERHRSTGGGDLVSGLASELEYQLLLAKDLGLLEAVDYQELAEQTTEIKRMLKAPILKLRQRVVLLSLHILRTPR